MLWKKIKERAEFYFLLNLFLAPPQTFFINFAVYFAVYNPLIYSVLSVCH